MDPKLEMRWPGGKPKALTFSYDDGVTQDHRLAALFRRYGMKATFNVNSGVLGKAGHLVREGVTVTHNKVPPEEVRTLYDGFEVAVHTLTHPDMSRLTDEEARREIMEDRKNLEALTGYPVVGMAWPGGSSCTNARVKRIAAACGIVYARGTDHETHRFELPDNPLDWGCSCRHWDLEPLVEPFLGKPGDRPWLLSVWGHAYEFDVRGDWDLFESQLRRLSGQDDVWYATNIEVFDYFNAWNGMRCSAEGDLLRNGSCLTLYGRIGESPVTIGPGETVRI